MKKQLNIILYFAIGILFIILHYMKFEVAMFVVKTLIMPVLAIYFITGIKKHIDRFSRLILFALFFSWGGDILAQSMAFVTLSISELARAYTSRSERYSLWGIGILSNPYMQYAVAASLVLLGLVVYVPFLQPIFNTVPLSAREWGVMLPLIFVPSIGAELAKWYLRRSRPPTPVVTPA